MRWRNLTRRIPPKSLIRRDINRRCGYCDLYSINTSAKSSTPLMVTKYSTGNSNNNKKKNKNNELSTCRQQRHLSTSISSSTSSSSSVSSSVSSSSSVFQSLVRAYQNRMLWLVYPKLSPSMTYGKVNWQVENYSNIECYDVLFQVETADLVQIQNKEHPDDIYRMDIESQEDGLLLIYPSFFPEKDVEINSKNTSYIRVGTPIGIMFEEPEISIADDEIDKSLVQKERESLLKYMSMSKSELIDAFQEMNKKASETDRITAGEERMKYDEETKAFFHQIFTPPLDNFYDENKLVKLREKQNIRIAMWQAYS